MDLWIIMCPSTTSFMIIALIQRQMVLRAWGTSGATTCLCAWEGVIRWGMGGGLIMRNCRGADGKGRWSSGTRYDYMQFSQSLVAFQLKHGGKLWHKTRNNISLVVFSVEAGEKAHLFQHIAMLVVKRDVKWKITSNGWKRIVIISEQVQHSLGFWSWLGVLLNLVQFIHLFCFLEL